MSLMDVRDEARKADDEFSLFRRELSENLIALWEQGRWGTRATSEIQAGIQAQALQIADAVLDCLDDQVADGWESTLKRQLPQILWQLTAVGRPDVQARYKGGGQVLPLFIDWYANMLEWDEARKSAMSRQITQLLRKWGAEPDEGVPRRETYPSSTVGAWDPLPYACQAWHCDAGIVEARRKLEWHYEELVEPIIQKQLLGNVFISDSRLDHEESRIAVGTSNLLGILELLAYAEDRGITDQHQVDFTFDYWLNRALTEPRYHAVRHYLALYGYEALTERVGNTMTRMNRLPVTTERAERNRRCLAVYGTLMTGERNNHKLEVATLLGESTLPGALYTIAPDQGDPSLDYEYPHYLSIGTGQIVVEVYEMPEDDDLVFAAIDGHELAHVEGLDGPEYDRWFAALDSTVDGVDAAWVYRYRLEDSPGTEIASGDWRHRA